MKGLEIRPAKYSEVNENKDQRIDSDFWTKEPYRNPKLAYEAIGKHLTLSQYGVSIAMNEDGEGVPIYRMNEIHNMLCDLSVDKYAALSPKEIAQFTLEPRDVLFNRTNSYEWVGRTGLFKGCRNGAATFASYLVRFRTNHTTVQPEYLVAFLNSKFGVAEIKRRSRHSINQTNVNPEEIKEILLPLLGDTIQNSMVTLFHSAHADLVLADGRLSDAEERLLSALGLANWSPPESLTYTARASDVRTAHRIDGQYYAPRIRALLRILGVDHRTVADVARPRREKFRPDQCVNFDYIEISDLDGSGGATNERLACADAPSRATWHVRPNDIITSSVRPIRRLSAQITPGQDGFVCSSGFVVVEPREIAPEVLLTYLRLPVICELLDLYASASMYPAIADADIFNLPLPQIPAAISEQIRESVSEAKLAKARAIQRLEAAKRAVEIAIEESEADAITYLHRKEEDN